MQTTFNEDLIEDILTRYIPSPYDRELYDLATGDNSCTSLWISPECPQCGGTHLALLLHRQLPLNFDGCCPAFGEMITGWRLVACRFEDRVPPICDPDKHQFFSCQVPTSDSCVAIYHKVCKVCRWDETKGIVMPDRIWKGWAVRQLEKEQNDESL